MKVLRVFTGFVVGFVFSAIAFGADPPAVQWEKTFGGGERDSAKSVRQITDGGYIITGYTGSFSVGAYDVYLIKTDQNGNEVWSKISLATRGPASPAVLRTLLHLENVERR